MALGIAFALASLKYGLFGGGGRIGPGLVPFAAGISLVVFGGSIGLQIWRRHEESVPLTPERWKTEESALEKPTPLTAGEEGVREQGVETGDEEGSNRLVALVFGLILIAILLIPVLGFLVSFGLLVLALVTIVEREGFLIGLALSIGAVAVTWLVFVYFLQVPLPQGIFVPGFGG